MQWMLIEPELHEQLALERHTREIMACSDLQSLREFGAQLLRQHVATKQLLTNAVNHIAALEAAEFQAQ
jgi:hypothetical protein